jgi:hypothetical protein
MLAADRNDGMKSHGMLNIHRFAKLSCGFTPETLVKTRRCDSFDWLSGCMKYIIYLELVLGPFTMFLMLE